MPRQKATFQALSILLVTMLHVGQLAQQSDIQVGRIVALNDFLAPIRMALFFAASGVFAGSALAKPWSHLLRHKVALYGWLFVLWTSVRWAFCGFALPNPDNPDEGSSILEIAWALIMPTTGLWFLWCLGIFFVLAKALRPFNPKLTLLAAVVVSIVSLVIADGPVQVDGSGLLGNLAHRNSVRYFVFFYGAAIFPQLVTRLGGWKLLPGLFGTLVAFVGCYALSRFMSDPVSAVARFVASLAGVAFLFLCARPLDAMALPSKVLRYLGVNTLPIYVAQVPLIIIYLTVLKAIGFNKLGFLGNLIVPIGVVLVVVLSLQLRRLLIRLGAGFMYRLPHFDRPITPAGTAAA